MPVNNFHVKMILVAVGFGPSSQDEEVVKGFWRHLDALTVKDQGTSLWVSGKSPKFLTAVGAALSNVTGLHVTNRKGGLLVKADLEQLLAPWIKKGSDIHHAPETAPKKAAPKKAPAKKVLENEDAI